MQTLRVCLAGAVMFLLCAGCFGNCITNFTDSFRCGTYGGSCSSSSYYGSLAEVAPEPEPTDLADAGVADAEVWPLYVDVDAPLP